MSAYLSLPKRYILIEGDTFELFRTGVVMANDPYAYNWRVECEKGAVFTRKYTYTPAVGDAGCYPMTITLEDDEGTVIDRKVVTLEVLPEPVQPAREINIACIGDSLTGGGQWVSEFARRLTTSGASEAGPEGWGFSGFHFRGSIPAAHGAYHEGYGGWSFKCFNSDRESGRFWWITPSVMPVDEDQHAHYRDSEGKLWCLETVSDREVKFICRNDNTRAPAGTLRWAFGGKSHADFEILSSRRASGNPFWDESNGKVDFARWGRIRGVPGLDIACVLLGWNSTMTPEEEYLDHVRTFIRNLHTAYPDCRIVLMGLQIPSQDGFGQSYGCDWNWRDKVDYIAQMDRRYERIAAEFEKVTFHSLAGQFDCEYGYPVVEEAPNVRSSARILRQSNCVHPSDEGFLQVADAMIRAVVGELAKL